MTDGPRPVVAILADDLIWSSRLGSIVERAGAQPRVCTADGPFSIALIGSAAAIVDLAARNADPFAAIGLAARQVPVVAVGPHEDIAARRQALAAGAARVFAYRKLHEDGPATIARAFGLAVAAPGERMAPADPVPAK